MLSRTERLQHSPLRLQLCLSILQYLKKLWQSISCIRINCDSHGASEIANAAVKPHHCSVLRYKVCSCNYKRYAEGVYNTFATHHLGSCAMHHVLQ